MPVLLKPYQIVRTPRGSTSRFYLGDCIEVLNQLPAQSIDVIVTSPPYNLGIRYNRYQDTLSPSEYLQWTDAWVAAATRILRPTGSLFLNVGARPSDPWTALDVAQAVRSRLRLQNIIHWIKSIAIEREAAGAAAGLSTRPGRRPLQADQQRSLPQRLPRVHLSLHAAGRDDGRPARARRPLPGPVEHRPVAGSGGRRSLPRQHLVHPVRDDPAARPRSPASGDLPGTPSRAVSEAARPLADRDRDGSVHRARAARLSRARGSASTSSGSDIDETYLKEAVQRTAEVKNVRALPERGSGADAEGEPARYCRELDTGRGGGLSTRYSVLVNTSSPPRGTLTSIFRRRCVGSGLLE